MRHMATILFDDTTSLEIEGEKLEILIFISFVVQ
jgi:hypothetical protein